MPTFAIKSQFDSSTPQKDHYRNRFDAIKPDRLTAHAFQYESSAKYNAQVFNHYDAESITPKNGNVIRFASEGRGSCQISSLFDVIKTFEHPSTGIPAKFEWTRSFDTGTSGRFQAIRPSYQQIANQFDSIIFLKYVGTSGRFDANSKMFEQLSNSFDVMPGYQNTMTPCRFDTIATTLSALPIHKQSFVKPGWRILLRNTETNNRIDLGFVEFDTIEKSIKDVALEDGDYEITILSSSLFWQNAIDRVVRNVTIHSEEEPTLGLPPILNLTSEVNEGVTTISWATNIGSYEDCTFGLWFATTPPVVTLREPDQTLVYTASEAEYHVNVVQTQSMWCVVMAMKGNMRGPASEIYLPWSNESPRRPADQMAFDVYLDEKLQQLKNKNATEENGGVEWNPENGYWG